MQDRWGFKMKKLPFGLKITPSVFQEYNIRYFSGINDLIIHFNEFIVAAGTKHERGMILKELLKRVRKFNVKCNKKIVIL